MRIERALSQRIAEHVVRRDITRAQVARLESHKLELPGVEVRANPHRYYPLHAVGAHTIGFLGEVSSESLTELSEVGYRSGDYIGRMGIERAFEEVLRGSPGIERQVVDASGSPQGEAMTAAAARASTST